MSSGSVMVRPKGLRRVALVLSVTMLCLIVLGNSYSNW